MMFVLKSFFIFFCRNINRYKLTSFLLWSFFSFCALLYFLPTFFWLFSRSCPWLRLLCLLSSCPFHLLCLRKFIPGLFDEFSLVFFRKIWMSWEVLDEEAANDEDFSWWSLYFLKAFFIFLSSSGESCFLEGWSFLICLVLEVSFLGKR